MDFTWRTSSEEGKDCPIGQKGMATVFWDSQDVIYIDYPEKGKMVTGLYYAELLGEGQNSHRALLC